LVDIFIEHNVDEQIVKHRKSRKPKSKDGEPHSHDQNLDKQEGTDNDLEKHTSNITDKMVVDYL